MTSETSKPQSPEPQPPGSNERRIVWAVLLLVAAAFLGLAIGTAIGARFFVPEGSGMAGPAIALAYGLAGVALSLISAGLLIWRGSFFALRITALGALTLAVLLVGYLTWRAVAGQQQRRADLGLDQPLPASEPWTLSARLPESDSTRSYREIEVRAEGWTFSYVAVGPEAAECRAKMIAAEATALSSQVAGLVDRLRTSPPPCAELDDPTKLFVTLRDIPGAPFHELEVSGACLKSDPNLADLAFSLRRLPIDALDRAQVECR